MPTPIRKFRCSDEEWQAALAAAEQRGDVLSDELRKFLRRYVRRHQSKG